MQVVPLGIESVNGSDVSMGCASPLVDSDSVVVCGSPCDSSVSYLVDDNSPVIDTSISNWASQLVTVRKNKKNAEINFDHIVLTFGFDTAVSPTAIELDLFICPEWNIAAPYISVYADESNGLVFSYSSVQTGAIAFVIHYTPSQSSCDFLSTVGIPLEHAGDESYFTWYIVLSFANQPDIEWVHVGEVTFLGIQNTAQGDSNASIIIYLIWHIL